MNSKKILVIFIFLLTIIFGGLAIYLISTLSTKQPEIDVTPTPTATTTVKPSTTVTGTVTVTPVACGQGCTNNTCSDNNTCVVVDGFRRCVANSCLSKEGVPAINAGCTSNYCTSATITTTATPSSTVKPSVTTSATVVPTSTSTLTASKTAAFLCVSGSTNKTANITITLNNTSTVPETFKVLDDITGNFSTQYIKSGSISNAGKLTANGIQWDNVIVPANGTLKLTYSLTLPATEAGKSYTNSIIITNSKNATVSFRSTVIVQVLPCTDLESDQIVIMIFGAILMLTGIIAFKMQWHQSLGNFFWAHGLENSYNFGNSANKTVKDWVSTLKAVTGIFTSGLEKRIATWKQERLMSASEKFEKKIYEEDKD